MSSFYTTDELQTIGFNAIGKNVQISRKCSIYMPEKISIGNNVRIDDFCCLIGGKQGIKIGSNIHIALFCLILGNAGVELKDFSGLSSRVSIYSANDDYSGDSLTNPTIPICYKKIFQGPVILNKHVAIGTNATILPNVTIGEGCAVGAYSLVNRDLADWGIFAGIPAKRIKERKKNLLLLEDEYIEKNRDK